MNGNIYYKITDVTDQRKVEERVVINRFNHAFWGFHYDRRIVTDSIEQFDVPANHRVKVELLGGEGKLRDITDPDNPKRRVWLLASRSLGEQQAPAS